MASSISLGVGLCSSSSLKATPLQHKQTPTSSSYSTLSKNLNFLSHSLSSLKLSASSSSCYSYTKLSRSSASSKLSLVPKSALADPEVETFLQESVPENPKGQEVFAVVMVGSRQYIVFPGRFIYTQRLKGANVNDKIILNKVLLVGTKTSTYIGKPIVPNAVVHAVVEEQSLDKKVIVFKYKKKKNYRRKIGHRQPITKIRILGITGYEDSPAVKLP